MRLDNPAQIVEMTAQGGLNEIARTTTSHWIGVKLKPESSQERDVVSTSHKRVRMLGGITTLHWPSTGNRDPR